MEQPTPEAKLEILLKKCTKCNETKPESEYFTYTARTKTKGDQLRQFNHCKTCHKAIRRKNYTKTYENLFQKMTPEKQKEMLSDLSNGMVKTKVAAKYGFNYDVMLSYIKKGKITYTKKV